MRIKTITAENMAEALKIIRTQLGPEALILSTRKTKNAKGEPTLEITAAVEEPATPSKPVAPLADILKQADKASKQPTSLPSSNVPTYNLPPELESRLQQGVRDLANNGFSATDALEMLLSKLIGFKPLPDVLTKGHAHVLLGPTGAGKTTLVAKLAIHAKRQGLKVGLMSLDDEKLAGFEPLRIVAEMLGDTAHLIRTAADLKTAASALGPRHILLIDTPGLNPLKREHLTAFHTRLKSLGIPTTNHLVLPATHHGDALNLLPLAFAAFAPASLMASKLDESPSLAAIVATAYSHNLPLGVGSHSPNPSDAPLPLTARYVAEALSTPPVQPWEIAQ
ncbi:MAG: hypothetical protein WAZ18_03185 [Alphaproteobacteria bacterium]